MEDNSSEKANKNAEDRRTGGRRNQQSSIEGEDRRKGVRRSGSDRRKTERD